MRVLDAGRAHGRPAVPHEYVLRVDPVGGVDVVEDLRVVALAVSTLHALDAHAAEIRLASRPRRPFAAGVLRVSIRSTLRGGRGGQTAVLGRSTSYGTTSDQDPIPADIVYGANKTKTR